MDAWARDANTPPPSFLPSPFACILKPSQPPPSPPHFTIHYPVIRGLYMCKYREFASEEVVQEVECWACRHKAQAQAAQQAAARLERYVCRKKECVAWRKDREVGRVCACMHACVSAGRDKKGRERHVCMHACTTPSYHPPHPSHAFPPFLIMPHHLTTHTTTPIVPPTPHTTLHAAPSATSTRRTWTGAWTRSSQASGV